MKLQSKSLVLYKKYIIKGLGGQIGYENDIQNCYKKKNTMVSDINKVISKSARTKITDKVKHTYDKTGNSYVSSHFYFLKNGNIAIQCYDWSKKLEKRFAWLKDQYKNPHETSHTLKEVLSWFDKNNIEYISSIPFENVSSDTNIFRKTNRKLKKLIYQ